MCGRERLLWLWTGELDTVLLSSKAQLYLGYKRNSFQVYTALKHNKNSAENQTK